MIRTKLDTVLLRLAAERGWRVHLCDEDGSGRVEIAPDIFLDIVSHGSDSDPCWKIGVSYIADEMPESAADLSCDLSETLAEALPVVLGVTPEELAEVRLQSRPT
jgi:hypothetical protein